MSTTETSSSPLWDPMTKSEDIEKINKKLGETINEFSGKVTIQALLSCFQSYTFELQYMLLMAQQQEMQRAQQEAKFAELLGVRQQ